MAASDQCSRSFVNGSLSIDRLTLLFYSPCLSLWNNGCDNNCYVNKMSSLVNKTLHYDLDPDFPQGSPTDLFKYHYRTVSGFDIQFGSKMPVRKKVTDEMIILSYGLKRDTEKDCAYQTFANEYAFRIEFNPNKSEHFTCLTPLFDFFNPKPCLSQIKIARMDIAIDYPAEVNPSMVLCDRCRKSFVATGQSGLETVYFGTRSSDNYFRLYNKRQEILDRDGVDIGSPLWRLELECKERFFLSDDPDHRKALSRFHFFSPSVRSGDWLIDLIQQQASIHGLQNVLKTMPLATQKRYRKFFNEFHIQDLISPVDIYHRDFLPCWHDVRKDVLFALGYDLVGVSNYGK